MIDKAETEEAERALIGAWLMDSLRVGMVLQRLKVRPAWWREPTRRTLVEVLLGMTEGNSAIDALMVIDRMKRMEGLDPEMVRKAPGEMERCVDECPSSAHAEYYAAILRREFMAGAIKRAFVELAGSLDITEPEVVAGEAAERMRAVLDENEVAQELNVERVLVEQVKQWRQATADRAAGKQPEIGVRMPWWKLTTMLGGLPNDLVVLAARPSVGKTALEGEIRTCVARQGCPTLSMLMDMGAERVLPRDLCRDGGVSMPKLKFGFARHDQLDAMEAAAAGLGRLPMYFVTKTTRLEMLAMRARHLKAQGRLRLITVDHCQLVTYAGSERHDMRQIVTRVTSSLKALAQELSVPVLLLSQLRRCEPGQQDREPELDDLRDSGSLEQDAAIVMMMHRDVRQTKVWKKAGDEEAMKDKKRPIKLMVKKNQDGGLGTVNLIMRPHYFTFELANQDYEPMQDVAPEEES